MMSFASASRPSPARTCTRPHRHRPVTIFAPSWHLDTSQTDRNDTAVSRPFANLPGLPAMTTRTAVCEESAPADSSRQDLAARSPELSVNWLTPPDATYPTLAEFLGSRGYATAGFAANKPYCATDSGLARGFTEYRDYDFPRLTAFETAVLVDRPTEGIWAIERFLSDERGRASINHGCWALHPNHTRSQRSLCASTAPVAWPRVP
jgi:hypothetical protein